MVRWNKHNDYYERVVQVLPSELCTVRPIAFLCCPSSWEVTDIALIMLGRTRGLLVILEDLIS
jgi:hypothetical protein